MIRPLVVTLTLALLIFASHGHETQTVGEGEASTDIVVGFATEPPFTDERNGLDLRVRRTGDGSPVAGLANSLGAELVAPDGETALPLQLRERHGEPGSYTADFLLTQPGVYTLRLTGFIGSTEVALTFELHEVRPLDDLRFP